MAGESSAEVPMPAEATEADIFQAAMATSENWHRQRILAEGWYRFGVGFRDWVAEHASEAIDEVLEALMDWLSGSRLTEHADEADSRVRVARDLYGTYGGRSLHRLLAVSILTLPEDHEERDVPAAADMLQSVLEESLGSGDIDEVLRTTAAIVEHELRSFAEAEDLLARGWDLYERTSDAEVRRVFLIAAEDVYTSRAMALRDEGDEEGLEAMAREAGRIIDMRIGDSSLQRPGDWAGIAGNLDLLGQYKRAAEYYGRTLDGADLQDPMAHQIVMRRGEVLLFAGEQDEAAQVLAPLLPLVQDAYVGAVLEGEVQEAGERLSQTAAALATAYAKQGRWDEALQALDAGRNVRLRSRASWRHDAEGARLLELERSLDRLLRAGEDPGEAEAPEGGTTPPRVRLLERYRAARPRVAPGILESPTVGRIAATLGQDEAALVLGIHPTGTLATLVTARDRDAPTEAEFIDEWTFRRWYDLLFGPEGEGWFGALWVRDMELDRPAILSRFLEDIEAGFGTHIARMLPRSGLRRLVVIAHRLLHLVPFWALPVLSHLDILMAHSAAELVARGRPTGPGPNRALVVANPTLDLPISPAEAAAVAASLTGGGLDVEELHGRDATEEVVRNGLSGASVFHFTGHGRFDASEPLRSALLVHPSDDLFSNIDGALPEWTVDERAEGSRAFRVPGLGNLREVLHPDGALERWLDRASGTLWGRFRRERLEVAAEMWTAGDIMIEESGQACQLAFLSACEVGLTGGGLIDEHTALPAALQLAGVDTLVSSMWPVSEPVTALFVDRFYGELTATYGEVDVAMSLRRTRQQLRAMARDEALSRLMDLASAVRKQWPLAALSLEAYCRNDLSGRPDPPFGSPWEWGSFYAAGSGLFHMKGEP